MSLSLALRQSHHLTMTPLLQRSIQLLQLSNQEFHQQVLEVISSNPFLETPESPSDEADSFREAESRRIDHQANEAGMPGSSDRESGTDFASLDEGMHRDSLDPMDRSQQADHDHDGSSAEISEPLDTAHESMDSMDSMDGAIGLGDFDGAGGSGSRAEDDGHDPWAQVGRQTSLREHLRAQAGLLRLSARDRVLVETVIDAIDDGGYLRATPEELVAHCPIDPVADEDDMRIALRHVQSMDPAGVGARDVSECLLLQLKALEPETASSGPAGLDEDTREDDTRERAIMLVRHHLRELAQHDFLGLQRSLGCSAAQLQAAVQLLRRLAPRPGSSFESESTQFVIADVIIRKRGGRWVAVINPEVIPRVRIHREHVALMRRARDADPQITQCVKEARWLVRNVHQRFQTIQQVAQAIVDHQSRYFEYGDMAMRPLTLAEIAQRTNMHESTVSRVTSRKYMATPKGLLEFKHFFGSHVSTAAGTPCSATAVRAVIQTLVESEDPLAPLSDIRLTRLLEKRGIQVARRTVSKYRDALRIPPVEMRRMTGQGSSPSSSAHGRLAAAETSLATAAKAPPQLAAQAAI